MSTIITFIGIAGLLYVLYSYTLKFFSLSKFVTHPTEKDVEIAEGLQGGIYLPRTGTWGHKSSLVRMRIKTLSNFEGCLFRQKELMGSNDSAYFQKTGKADFDNKLALFKTSKETLLLFHRNIELRTLVLDYFKNDENLMQLKFKPGYIEVVFINNGDRALEYPDRLKYVTIEPIKIIKKIRSAIE